MFAQCRKSQAVAGLDRALGVQDAVEQSSVGCSCCAILNLLAAKALTALERVSCSMQISREAGEGAS